MYHLLPSLCLQHAVQRTRARLMLTNTSRLRCTRSVWASTPLTSNVSSKVLSTAILLLVTVHGAVVSVEAQGGTPRQIPAMRFPDLTPRDG